MKVAGVSDIHGMWDQISYPPADILCFAGDILKNYSYDRRQDAFVQLEELAKLNAFLGNLKDSGTYKEIFVVAGNHDFVFEHLEKYAREMLTNAVYLQDETVNFGGPDGKIWKIHGSPWQPWFYDWAFNFPDHNANFFRARAHAQSTWAMIPDDADILVTHGPPEGLLDQCYDGQRVGCRYLRERITDLKLHLHIFGHIHYSYGTKVLGGFGPHSTIFMNAAACGEDYKPDNPIQVVEVSKNE